MPKQGSEYRLKKLGSVIEHRQQVVCIKTKHLRSFWKRLKRINKWLDISASGETRL